MTASSSAELSAAEAVQLEKLIHDWSAAYTLDVFRREGVTVWIAIRRDAGEKGDWIEAASKPELHLALRADYTRKPVDPDFLLPWRSRGFPGEPPVPPGMPQ